MSESGRKYQHPEPTRAHAPVTAAGLKASTKVLVVVIVLAIMGVGWGLLNAGVVLAVGAGIGEALP